MDNFSFDQEQSDELCVSCNKKLVDDTDINPWAFNGLCDAMCAIEFNFDISFRNTQGNISMSVKEEFEKAVKEIKKELADLESFRIGSKTPTFG